MSITSKTGLLASPKKKVSFYRSQVQRHHHYAPQIPSPVSKQIEFSLRPFGGLFNPYSPGCSILCNHPASLEVKTIVKKAKEAWIIEGKAFLQHDSHGRKSIGRKDSLTDYHDHVPEEFIRRYTDTDSRPLTPTPTIASGRTRNSAVNSIRNSRRCVTPEPSSDNIKERKQIILDLRRSHSQETLFWNASSELSAGAAGNEPWIQRETKSGGGTTAKTSTGSGKNVKISEKIQITTKQQARMDTTDSVIPPLTSENSLICVNARDDFNVEEEDNPRRRGKKRKKNKVESAGLTPFHQSQDPETQVSALGPDSPNFSNRPSLIPNGNGAVQFDRVQSKFGKFNLLDDDDSSGKPCYLDEDCLKILRRGLNIDVVENSFEKYMHRALQEAYHTIPSDKVNYESDVVKNIRETLNLRDVDHVKWLNLPRKYTRSLSRFELPIDSSELAKLKPLEYLSKYVIISKSQKQIFRRVFIRNWATVNSCEDTGSPMKTLKLKPNQDDTTDSEDENYANLKNDFKSQHALLPEERVLPKDLLTTTMHEALGFHGTMEKIGEIKNILQLNDMERDTNFGGYDFRSLCGILAFAERYLNRFDRMVDPCDEIETTDFESLERKLKTICVEEKLSNVLKIIKYN